MAVVGREARFIGGDGHVIDFFGVDAVFAERYDQSGALVARVKHGIYGRVKAKIHCFDRYLSRNPCGLPRSAND